MHDKRYPYYSDLDFLLFLLDALSGDDDDKTDEKEPEKKEEMKEEEKEKEKKEEEIKKDEGNPFNPQFFNVDALKPDVIKEPNKKPEYKPVYPRKVRVEYAKIFALRKLINGIADAVDDIIKNISSEPAPGKWIRTHGRSDSEKYVCPSCINYSSKEYDYCPNCGRKMEKTDKMFFGA